MVDTTLSQPAAIEPPFADNPRDPAGTFSQPWNAYFTLTAARAATLAQQVSDLATQVATLAPVVDDVATLTTQVADLESRVTVLETGARHGVTDGSDAAPGVIGEYASAVASGASLTTNVVTNVVSLSLAAGDWDVYGNVVFVVGTAGTFTLFGVGMGAIDTYMAAPFPVSDQEMNTMQRRYSLTATTTVWVVAEAIFSSGTLTATGFIQARRVR